MVVSKFSSLTQVTTKKQEGIFISYSRYRRMAKQGVTVAFSQYDLVLTQWAFVSGPILFGESLGFNRMTEEEKSLYVKTFYKVGRDLGKFKLLTENMCRDNQISLSKTQKISKFFLHIKLTSENPLNPKKKQTSKLPRIITL